MKAVNLRTEFMHDPLGIDINMPLLSWICEGGKRQTAFELSASENGEEIFNSGKLESREMRHRWTLKGKSRQRVYWKVRLWDENDVPGDWSDEAFFEFGLLNAGDWKARWIDPEKESLTEVNNRPASYLKASFSMVKSDGTRLDDAKPESAKLEGTKPDGARLYITAHGMYHAYLNGTRVGDAVLTPGTSEYKKRLEYQTYDVTALIKDGDNEIEVILGDGWYRGKSGMNNTAGNLYGTDISLLAQLEVEGSPILLTDGSWQASQSGPIMKNGLDFGELTDARRVPDDWHSVRIEEFGYENLVCSNNVPVKEKEEFTGKCITTPEGKTVIDFGQNMAGYVSFTVEAHAGQKVRLVHGESLDKDGNFTIENFQNANHTPEKRVPQEINYICKEGMNHYKPSFSIFGFQYALVETDIPVEKFSFHAHAVYSDMEQTGFFECGNAPVNQLFHNSIWSMKGNFADIPTDCPTRERSGWTGDCGAFVKTGAYLMNCYPVLRKWLCEVRAEQCPNGAVPGVAPLNEQVSAFKKLSDGSAGWGDAIGIVPYTLSGFYGTETILEENYDALKRWVDFSVRRASKTRLRNLGKFGKHAKYTVDKGFHWGEWLEPDVSSVTVLKDTLMKGAPEVPTAYLAYSSQLLSDIAERLGKEEDRRKYSEIAEKARAAYHNLQYKTGRIESERQAQYVRPIALDLISEEEKKDAAKALNELVIKCGYHLNTGFLSTPHLTGALSRYGYTDTAYKLLLQDTSPSWLYSVKKGANTIWETWNGIDEDGNVHDSLNHYSYGAITGWLFDSVAGIRIDGGRFLVEPQPDRSLGFVKASYDSVYGTIVSSWKYNEDKGEFEYEITVPSNMTAVLRLPGHDEVEVEDGTHRFA